MVLTESAAVLPARLPSSTFWAAGALGILATAVGAVLPVLVGVWQKQAGLPVDQAGFVAAMELSAQVAGTGLFLWASPRWTSKSLAAVGLGVMVVGNVTTAMSASLASLLLARAIGGAGGGMLRALCMMALARASSPGRAFAVYAGAQVGLAAVTTAFIPGLTESQGARAPFLILTVASMAGFALCPLLPRRSALPPPSAGRGAGAYPAAAIGAIVALFVFFAGQGALWTYLAPIGVSRSISTADVTRALTLLNFAGLVGALGVGALAHRVDARIALLTLLATEVAAIVGLFSVQGSAGFAAASSVFYFSWCASFPFQFAVISRSDPSGRASAAVPAADGLGLAGGAALGGLVLPGLGLGASGWICASASVASIVLYLWSLRLSKEPARAARPPATANASPLER